MMIAQHALNIPVALAGLLVANNIWKFLGASSTAYADLTAARISERELQFVVAASVFKPAFSFKGLKWFKHASKQNTTKCNENAIVPRTAHCGSLWLKKNQEKKHKSFKNSRCQHWHTQSNLTLPPFPHSILPGDEKFWRASSSFLQSC